MPLPHKFDLRFEGCLTNASIEAFGRRVYAEEYVNQRHKTHDGVSVRFFEDRFDHAFFRSKDFVRSNKQKNEIDPLRVERILWIGPLIRGELTNSECHRMPNSQTNQPQKRLYILNDERYVVWLEPQSQGTWKFSSAYVAFGYQLKSYRKGSLQKFKLGPSRNEIAP